MNFVGKTLITITAVTLGACTTFRYDNQAFRRQADALAYQEKVLSAGVQGLKPADVKVGGTLRVYFPNQDVVKAKTIIGNATDYLITATLAEATKIKQAFEQRKAFDAVELKYSQGEHRKAEPDAYVLYFYAESPQVLGWYYIGTVVPKSPVAFDRGTSDKTEKYRQFAESVESLAMAEKVATRK